MGLQCKFLTNFYLGKFRRRATGRYEEYKRNAEIKFKDIRVVLEGKWVKDMTREEAMSIAESQWMDLVMISPWAKPPICKIIDYWQFLYQQKKKENVKHKNNKKSEIKWIRLTINIGKHDFDIKVKKAKEFLEEKNFVKATMQFKWRELAHSSLWLEKMKEFAQCLSEVAKVEQEPKMQWRQLTLLLTPWKSKK